MAGSILAAMSCSDKSGQDPTLELKYVPSVVKFTSGESKTYMVESSNVTSIETVCPQGWTADCTTSSIVITAPDQKTEGIATEGQIEVRYKGTGSKTYSVYVDVVLEVDNRPVLSFELSYDKVTNSSVNITVIPSSNDVPYFCNVTTKEVFDKYEGNMAQFVADQVAAMQEKYPTIPLSTLMESMLETGPIENDVVRNLPASTDLVLFALTADKEAGEAYGDVYSKSFTTLAPGKPEDCVFTFEIDQLRSTSVRYNVMASDASVRYWAAVDEVRRWTSDEDMQQKVKTSIDQMAKAYGISVTDLVSQVQNYGDIQDSWTDLTEGLEHYLYAFAIDELGNAVGPMFKTLFQTPLTDVSDADMDIQYKYFDGDAVMAAYPDKYTGLSGRWLIQVKSEPNPYTYAWVVALSKGDYTDTEKYPDNQTYTAIGQGGIAGKEITEFKVPQTDNQVTILNFAFDKEGTYGPLHRTLVNLASSGASPASELFVSTGGDVDPNPSYVVLSTSYRVSYPEKHISGLVNKAEQTRPVVFRGPVL